MTLRERFDCKWVLDPETGCWEWTAARNSKGRARFRVGDRLEAASRVAWTLYRGPIPAGLWVLHTCDNGGCVNPDHLYLGTRADNARDATERGRWASVLSPSDVRLIRELDRSGISRVKIARRLGVARGTVRFVLAGHTWRHVI